MLKQAAKIEDQAPLHGNSGTVSRPVEGVPSSSSLKSFQQGTNAGRNRDGVGLGHAPLGAREGDGAGMQIDQSQVQPGLAQSAAGVVSDFKRDAHPLFGRIHGQMIGKAAPDGRDFVVGKDRPLGHGRFFGSVVEHRHRANFAQQATLPVQPFYKLNVVGRQIATDGPAIGSRNGRAPGDVLLRMDGGELLQAKVVFRQKAADPVPAVAVVPFGGFADRMGLDYAGDPAVVGFADRALTDRQVRGLLGGLGPVKSVVRAVAGCLGGPLAIRGFVPNPVPRTVFSFVNGSHVTIVSNHPKTQTNKG